jgi:hypothetical protein
MKKLPFVCYLCIVLASCSGNKNKEASTGGSNATGSERNDSTKHSYFPVTSFIQGQLNVFDSLPVTILQVTTVNNQTDSVWLPRNLVKPLLQPFTRDLIDKENLLGYFKESTFNDQSTESITFTYDPITVLPDSISLRHWDVYVDPEKGTIKRVYIVKELSAGGDSSDTQQLTWQTGKWAKIVTIRNKPGASTLQSEVRWIWDFSE